MSERLETRRSLEKPGHPARHWRLWALGAALCGLAGAAYAAPRVVQAAGHRLPPAPRHARPAAAPGPAGRFSYRTAGPVTFLQARAASGNFEGSNYDDNAILGDAVWIPPGPTGAAGPNHLVSAVNSLIQWRTKSGVVEQHESLRTFFAPLTPSILTVEPKVTFDQMANRFVVVAAERHETAFGDASDSSRLLIAVSQDADPNDGWNFQALDATVNIDGTDCFPRVPDIAVDGAALYITVDMTGFIDQGGNFRGTRVWIADKSSFYSGGAISANAYDPFAASGFDPGSFATLAPTQVYGATGVNAGVGTFLVSGGWVVSSHDALSLIRVDNPLGAPVFTNTYVNLGDIGAQGGYPDAPQPGSGTGIQDGSADILNQAVWRHNKLYCANTVNPPSGADSGQATVHWYAVDASDVNDLTLADQGDVGGEDIAPGTFTYEPSVAVDANDDLAIGFSASSPTTFVGAYYTVHKSGDPSGSVEASRTLAAGLDTYVRTFGSGVNSWGPGSAVALDPSDDTTFWPYNAYALTRGSAADGEDGRWGTRWGSFGAPITDVEMLGIEPAPDPAVAGSPLTYVVQARNNDAVPSGRAQATFTLPANVAYQSSSADNGGTTAFFTGAVTATFDSIPANTTATLTVNVTVDSSTADGTVLSSSATVSCVTDDTPGNNNATNNVAVSHPSPIVTSTDDASVPADGKNTLSEAIQYCNAHPGADTITFAIPTTDPGYHAGTGVWTLTPSESFEDMTDDGTTIDGFSATGASTGTLKIQIDLSNLSPSSAALDVFANACVVKGLNFTNFAQPDSYGMWVDGGNNTISGNLIGTDISGTTVTPSTFAATGILVISPGNTIGGTTAAERNVISVGGAPGVGVKFTAGLLPLVHRTSKPRHLAPRKLTIAHNVVEGNYIGTDITGTVALGNVTGVQVGSGSNTVGGTAAGSGNVISGNTTGIALLNAAATGNLVQGNFIGLAVDGTTALGNATGVAIDVSAASNTIGGTGSGAANTIANNSGNGVEVRANAGSGNSIQGNSIHDNGKLGIDLQGGTEDANGVTANDAGDTDSGPNDLQNYPVITSIDVSGNSGTVNGTLDTDAVTGGQDYQLDFYTNATADPSGFGEGQVYLGQTTVHTDDSGHATFAYGIAALTGHFITATATSASGDTSEFCQAFAIPAILHFGSATYAVGEGAGTATITVIREGTSSGAASVHYDTSDGTATQPADYATASGTLNWADGDTDPKLFNVSIVDDALDENDETVNLALSSPSGAVLSAPSSAVLTITDNDPLPSLSIDNPQVTEGDTGTANLTYTVTLNTPSGRTVMVDYATADGTANQPADYQATNGTLTFAAGETTKQITVLVNGDTTDENDETVLVNLSNPVNATIATTPGTGTILDDDAPPTVSVDDQTVTEGDSGTVPMTFNVTLSAASGKTVTIDYATADGTATQPADYQATNGTLSFAPGETSKQVTVLVNGDTTDENDETLFLNLSNPGNVTVADGQGLGTIVDDDNPPTVSVDDQTVTEGNAGTVPMTFNVTLSAASGKTVTIDYATADGTATQPADYQATNGTLSFAPGETSKQVTVLVNGDTTDENDETLFLNLSNPGNVTIADGQGLGTIIDDDGPPGLSINNPQVLEGNSGTTDLTFTVTLDAASGKTVTVDYSTADGTAKAPQDYTALGKGTLTFAPGQTTKTVTVKVRGDTTDEFDETLFVNLANATNATITTAQGTGTILNDDTAPSLSIDDPSIKEGDSGTVNLVFHVTLSALSGKPITVNYSTADGTATGGADYVTQTNKTLSFAPGQLNGTITVQVKGDTTDEFDETLFVNLSGATHATIADAQGQGTILDDDAPPTIAIADQTVVEGTGGTTNMAFNVTLSAASGKPITVDYATTDGTATTPADYTAVNGSTPHTVTFAPGQTTQPANVTVQADAIDEPDETFTVTLSNPVNTGAITRATATGTIQDDDNPPGISASNASVTEGNSGTVDMVFNVTLSGPSGRTVKVDYSTSDGTATAPSDYTAIPPAPVQTLTFAPGETAKTVTVSVNGDTLDEGNETLFLNLANPFNSSLTRAQGTGTIVNDDSPVSMSINDVSIAEGDSGTANATFTVTLSGVSGRTVTAAYATADGTATAPADYTAKSGSISFGAGATSRTITVPVQGDTLNETDETFFVDLSNVVNATVSKSRGQCTILDNDAPPTVAIANAAPVTEGDSGTTPATFNVTLSAPSGKTVSVDYATADGTATAPADYLPSGGKGPIPRAVGSTSTVTFNPGETSKAITVQVVGDTIDEPDETFFVNLSNPQNANLGNAQGMGTIIDDDNPPALSVSDVTQQEGNSGTTNFVFNVTLNTASGKTVTVNYATADGTATAPSDYSATSGSLTFTPGQTAKTVTVSVNGDTSLEANETFTLNLSGAQNASINRGTGTGTITNDDGAPSLSIADPTPVVEGNSGSTPMVFTVTLSQATGVPVTVHWATGPTSAAPYPATANVDYQTISGDLTFNPGVVTRTLSVPIIGDVLDEYDENFAVTLSNPTNAVIGSPQANGLIQDDDPLPTVTVNDISTGEGAAGTTHTAFFTVTLSAVSGRDVQIGYTMDPGTADGNDFVSVLPSVITIPAGHLSTTQAVLIKGDNVDEDNETFFCDLNSPVNCTIARSRGTCTINDDDPPAGLSVNNVSVSEGAAGTTTSATFTVTLEGPTAKTVTVNYATADGTATIADNDYAARTGSLTFTPGQTSKPVTVPVKGDAKAEADETFKLVLSGPVNAVIDQATGIGTILNDDSATGSTAPKPSPAAPATSPIKLSAASASAAQQTVTLTFTGAVDATTSTDATRYTVTSNGVAVAAASVALSGNHTAVTLGLPEGSLASGDSVSVGYHLLDGKGLALKGTAGPVAVR